MANKLILITRTDNQGLNINFEARVVDSPLIKGYGKTRKETLGNLLDTHRVFFGVDIDWDWADQKTAEFLVSQLDLITY